MKKTYTLSEIQNLDLKLERPSLVFLYGDLWSGKTTMVQSQIQNIQGKQTTVHSPTYVYYNLYKDINHFDLYRLKNYDEFVSIWWEEILDNNEGIIFVEWPEILEPFYTPDVCVTIQKGEDENLRTVEILRA